MKTTLAALFAVAALSTAALAASEDRAPVYPEKDIAVSSNTSNTFAVAPVVTDKAPIANYLNQSQLR